MAIETDDAIEKFGTADDVSSSSSSVASTSLSVAADTADWTNDDDAPYASVIFEGQFATAPTLNGKIELLAQLKSVGGAAADMLEPSTGWLHVSLGFFAVKDVTSRQHIPIEVFLPNTETSQIYRFFIRNVDTGQTISSGWQLWIVPKAIGPSA